MALLIAKRTGTLLLDGWEPALNRTWNHSGERRPVYISLEDVRTFDVGVPKPDYSDDLSFSEEALLAMGTLDRGRKAVLEQAWMPRS